MSKASKDYQRIINTLDIIAQDEQLAGMEAKELVREAMDIIHDYESVVADHNRMVEHYETAEMTIKRQAGVYVCPNCGKRMQVGLTVTATGAEKKVSGIEKPTQAVTTPLKQQEEESNETGHDNGVFLVAVAALNWPPPYSESSHCGQAK